MNYLQCVLVSEEDEEATFVDPSLRGRSETLYRLLLRNSASEVLEMVSVLVVQVLRRV